MFVHRSPFTGAGSRRMLPSPLVALHAVCKRWYRTPFPCSAPAHPERRGAIPCCTMESSQGSPSSTALPSRLRSSPSRQPCFPWQPHRCVCTLLTTIPSRFVADEHWSLLLDASLQVTCGVLFRVRVRDCVGGTWSGGITDGAECGGGSLGVSLCPVWGCNLLRSTIHRGWS